MMKPTFPALILFSLLLATPVAVADAASQPQPPDHSQFRV